MLRPTAILTLLMVLLAPESLAQQPPPADDSGEIDPQLRQLLTAWSQNSGQIRKLRGEVLRRTYEQTFAVERMSEGQLYYEGPDKGRLDIIPIPVTPELLEARQQPDAQVRRDDKNQPFKLESDGAEKWVCDGRRVFSIQDDNKTAHIQELPPDVQGENIMNSPLPFLFGLPPGQALQRFHLRLVQPVRRGDQTAYLEAVPRLRMDGANWKQADIILDLRSWLPRHVRLIDPSGDRETVYSFTGMKANGIFDSIWTDPFKPNLRGYTVEVASVEDPPEAIGQLKPERNAVPNVTGLPHTDAAELLVQQGIDPENILKLKGGPARRAADVYHVREQKPGPGTPLTPGMKVSLYLWEKGQG